MTTTKAESQSRKISKVLGISLLCILVGLFLLYKFKSAVPPPDCNLAENTGYTGQQMWDFGIKNKVFFRDNPKQAACWFEKGAKAGHLSSISSIARVYETGEGVTQSYSKAIYWHKQGITKGNSGSYYLLGNMYEAGRGVRKNIPKAIELWKKAANLRNGGAKSKLKKYEN